MRSVGLKAFNPNDPMTWNSDGDDAVPVMSPQEPDFLSEADLSSLLSTPMGTSPTSEDGMAVFKAVIQNEKPLDAADAISQGMQLSSKGDFSGALELFEMALTLPGSGTLRDRKKARELSEGEKISALYNIACCHSQLGDERNGLVSLAGSLEAGFDDFDTARTDPDLAPLRENPQFEGLLLRFQPEKKAGIFGILNNLGF